jgi:hypothetical protein
MMGRTVWPRRSASVVAAVEQPPLRCAWPVLGVAAGGLHLGSTTRMVITTTSRSPAERSAAAT